jgi:hypothetical protein
MRSGYLYFEVIKRGGTPPSLAECSNAFVVDIASLFDKQSKWKHIRCFIEKRSYI